MSTTYELGLISKALNDNVIAQQNITDDLIIIKELMNKLESLINLKYKELIEGGNYFKKENSLEELKYIYNCITMYVKYPMLIGKTVVGVMFDNKYSRNGMMSVDLGINESKFNLSANDVIPVLYFNGDESLNIVNKFDFISEVVPEDISIVLDNLINKRKIDLRQNIISIINSQNMKYENIVIILFPKFGDKYSQSFKELVNITDFIVLNGEEKLQIFLNYLSKIDYKNKIYLKTICNKILGNLNLDINKFEKNIFKSNNRIKYNIDFISMIDNVILEQIKYYKDENIELYKNIKKLKKVIIIQDEDNKFRDVKKSMETQIENNNELLEKIEYFRNEVFEVISKLINIIENCTGINHNIQLDSKREEILYERCEKLLQIGYYDEAEEIRGIFRDNIRGKILNLKLAKAKNINLDKEDLYFLHECNLKEDYVLKSKIEFRDELKISKIETEEIVNNIKYLTSAEEFYIKANSLKNKSLESSKRFYKLGAEHNHPRCKDKLYNLYIKEDDNLRNMEYLASLLHKDANYYMANHYKNHTESKCIFHLKLAAAFNHLGAIYDLAEVSLNNEDYDSAILLYDYLCNSSYKEEECLLKLGETYFKSKQYHKATDILEKCNDISAYYMLGKIYEYGMGRMKDWDKAMNYYHKASNLGHLKAKTRYIKMKERLEENKQKNNYNKSGNYSSSTTYESHSSSSTSTSKGCFITTAICKYLGKGEDCDELIKIKEIRDNYVIKQPNGEQLISEYYRIAPKIVEKINEVNDPIKEYKYLWEEYLNICYEYLLEDKYENAMNIYIKMVEYLKRKYL